MKTKTKPKLKAISKKTRNALISLSASEIIKTIPHEAMLGWEDNLNVEFGFYVENCSALEYLLFEKALKSLSGSIIEKQLVEMQNGVEMEWYTTNMSYKQYSQL